MGKEGRSGSLRLGQPYKISESYGEIKSVLYVRGLALQAYASLLSGLGHIVIKLNY